TLRVLLTRHGPIINDVIDDTPGVIGPIAFRWTALDPSTLFKSVLQVDLATNWDQFRQALSYWDVPSQNFVYADVDGNIGYQTQDDRQARALDQVRAWDKRYETDRAGGAVYQVWYWFLLKNTLDVDLGQNLADKYMAGQYESHGTLQLPFMTKIMAQPNSSWF